MTRVVSFAWNEAIIEAFKFITPGFQTLCSSEWFIGASPLQSGLHEFSHTSDGTSYEHMAHVAYPFHLRSPRIDSIPVIVLPHRPSGSLSDVATIVHELGHVAHWWLDFKPEFAPVSKYAESNSWEAFAEAWSVYCLGSPIMSDAFSDVSRPLSNDELERMRCLLI